MKNQAEIRGQSEKKKQRKDLPTDKYARYGLIDPLWVECFVLVAKTGSFTQASVMLGISKSSVSKCVAALEELAGVRLFNRTTRNLLLSEAGKKLLPESKKLTEHFNGFIRDLKSADFSEKVDESLLQVPTAEELFKQRWLKLLEAGEVPNAATIRAIIRRLLKEKLLSHDSIQTRFLDVAQLLNHHPEKVSTKGLTLDVLLKAEEQKILQLWSIRSARVFFIQCLMDELEQGPIRDSSIFSSDFK